MALSSDVPPGCSPGIRYEGSQQECRYQEGKEEEEEEEEEDEEDISFTSSKAKKKRRIQYSAEKWKYHVVCHHKSLTFKDQKNFFFLSFFSSAAKEKRREEERTDGLDMGLNLLYCNTIAPREDV